METTVTVLPNYTHISTLLPTFAFEANIRLARYKHGRSQLSEILAMVSSSTSVD